MQIKLPKNVLTSSASAGVLREHTIACHSFGLFHMTDFSIYVFVCALVTHVSWVGLSWKRVVTYFYAPMMI